MFCIKKLLFFSLLKNYFSMLSLTFKQSLFTPTLNIIKNILHFFLSNLHLQVVTIHGKGLSPFFKLLIFFSYFFLIGRFVISLLCTYYNIPEYFDVDLTFRWQIYKTRHTYFTYLIILYYSIFPARLFCLLYFNVDKVVWGHLFDLVARNRAQVKLQLKLKQNNRRTVSKSWSSQFCSFFRFRLKVFSSKLQYYSFLEQSQRIRWLIVYFAFEFILAYLLLPYAISWIDHTIWLFYNHINRNLNVVQRFFNLASDFSVISTFKW